jgi:outer membrane protein TolC
MSVYNDALLSAKTYEESINLGYKNSLKSIIDVYEARNKIFEIEAEYIQNIQNFIDSYVGFLILTDNLDNLSLIDTIIKK